MSKNDKTIFELKNKHEETIKVGKIIGSEGEELKEEPKTKAEESQVENIQSKIVESPPEEIECRRCETWKDQLTNMAYKVEEYKDQFLRVKAEIDNLRKRTEREKADAIKYGASRLLTDLFPVVDSLIHGLQSPESQDPYAKNIREGMNLTLELLYKILSKHGVEIIDPKPGDFFNPAFHEAMSVQKMPTAKADTIVQVMQNGYRLNGRVLRAARVIVVG
ncbi:nucleotide exchange factor GrpE [Coxiella endosymbiont of Amblyomma nuttalli]|uniref:nucleotide exchange factor GrpE n=1 Tax=Coxiella endosymbiont of Amblyomma nuttalli TaxID=2749996 RepID=UPI001BAA340C|nr:nucleotide exchange factor GrpE [Coxiella endosymbiont of Amblyomma nuttalli]QTS83974.1 Protein GrpE [Coxiella endosymbiont of Amblyomma nuttalli]